MMAMELSGRSRSYYSILGVPFDSSNEEIRRAYRKLAMKWHPDRWARDPSVLGEAKQKFQQIQEAYSVLSDRNKRSMYDAGLYDPDDEDDEAEGFADFLQEMMSLMENVRKEDKMYGMEELRGMFWEMARDFKIPEWPDSPQQMMNNPLWSCGSMRHGTSGSSMTGPWEARFLEGDPFIHMSSFEMRRTNPFCR